MIEESSEVTQKATPTIVRKGFGLKHQVYRTHISHQMR
nr:hypothetical protein [Dolosigranulum pigrum]